MDEESIAIELPLETDPSGRDATGAQSTPVETPTRTPALRSVQVEWGEPLRPLPLWIAWESQRRSLTLAKRVGARPHFILSDRGRWIRYPVSLWKTLKLLRAHRGGIVFVQNPSMVLAAFAALVKRRFNLTIVVDRHSNFAFLESGLPRWKRLANTLLSDYSIRRADLTIVTNAELVAHVEERGGRAFVLPDPFPEIPARALPGVSPMGSASTGVPRGGLAAAGHGKGVRSANGGTDDGLDSESRPLEVLFVASWSPDEPIAEVVEACRQLEGEVVVRITGRAKRSFHSLLQTAPPNFVPTGYLPEAEYFERLRMADAVMAVSTRPATLTCGAYEAVAVGKPLLLGDSRAQREYFDGGALFTNGSASDIEGKLRALREVLPILKEEARRLHRMRRIEGDVLLQQLLERVTSLASVRPATISR